MKKIAELVIRERCIDVTNKGKATHSGLGRNVNSMDFIHGISNLYSCGGGLVSSITQLDMAIVCIECDLDCCNECSYEHMQAIQAKIDEQDWTLWERRE